MGRTFYSDYVDHCMRFYARYPHPKFRSQTDKRNWNACDTILGGFTDDDKEILLSVYREKDTVPDTVFKLAKNKGIPQDKIWDLISELELKVAKKRDLIS